MGLDLGTLSGTVDLNVTAFEKKYRDVDQVLTALEKSDPTVTLTADTSTAVRALNTMNLSAKDLQKVFASASDEVERSLQDAARSGALSAKDLQRAHEKAAGQLAAAYNDALAHVQTDAKRAGDVIDRETHTGTGKAGEAVKEFKNEAAQNFAETASSFNGSMSSIADMALSTFGGLGAMGGPIGLAAGAIAMFAGTAFAAWQKQVADTKERVSNLMDDLIGSQTGMVTETFISEQLQKIAKDTNKLQAAQKAAGETGVDYGVVLRAMAGDVSDAAQVTAAYDEKIAAHQKTAADMTATLQDGTARTQQQTEAIILQRDAELDAADALENHRKTYQLATTDLDAARVGLDAYNAAMGAAADKTYWAQQQTDALIKTISDLHGGQFTIDFLNYDQTYKYLQNTQTLIRSITGDKAFRIATGPGGTGGQVLARRPVPLPGGVR